MEEWKPRRAEAFAFEASLTTEEHRVYAELDGHATAPELALRTGMPLVHLNAILARLLRHGALARSVVAARATAPRQEPVHDAIAEPFVDDAPAEVTGEGEAPNDSATEADDDDVPETAESEAAGRNYRKIYETELHPLPRDDRVAEAAHATGSRLLALCFDADPQVVRAVLDNATAGLEHARLIATHHKNPVGLEMLVARAELGRDGQVHRRLLRNDQLTESLLKRLLVSKRMLAIYKLAHDRDIPERSRSFSRGHLRQKFASAGSDERAEVILVTEGRVLPLLVGQTLDARTTSLLCARSFASVALIQNLTRFAACPPPLLVHLVKLPMVKRQPSLKKALLQHPNMPSDVKRALG